MSVRASLQRPLLLLLAATCVSLLGCASTRSFQTVEPAGSGKALVHFIRKKYPPYIHQLYLSVDGTALGTLANNDIIAVNVPVGEHRVALDVIDGKPLVFNLSVPRAEDMYVVLSGDVTKTGDAYRSGSIVVYLQWTLRAVPVSKAEATRVADSIGMHLD